MPTETPKRHIAREAEENFHSKAIRQLRSRGKSLRIDGDSGGA
jgi:hypothetical protein